MKALFYSHQLGREAENRAVAYLAEKGYILRRRNYRFEKAEIDLIVERKNLLVFIEVKVRSNLRFGYPENFVSLAQKENYLAAATYYIEEKGWENSIRFDIIAMTPKKPVWEITHFEDAFY